MNGGPCRIEGCEGTARTRGLCAMHYHRYERTGDPTLTRITPMGERWATFHRLVANDTDECVLWPYTPGSGGYGILTIKDRSIGAHVLACEERNGPRPPWAVVAHACDVRLCINPRHLSWATPAENHHQMIERWRHRYGEQHHAARLTDEGVRELRFRYRDGESISGLANDFRVARATIRNAIRGKTWKHVGWERA